MKMQGEIVKAKSLKEYFTPEYCFIRENLSIEKVSIARARVKPGVTTLPHHLIGTDEIYIITKGKGKVYVGNLDPAEVAIGDIVMIPAGISQKITNVGKGDLIFYCICAPRFSAECYVEENRKVKSPKIERKPKK